ncbi:hypothetical protein AMR41_00230 [Hapalosiphon sp. MRB220]|nr:hypothetical protein AMR41_00230 [Hapalosiphon sp. MRB220]
MSLVEDISYGKAGSRFSLANFVHRLSDHFGVFTVKGLLIAIIPGNKTDKLPRPLQINITKSDLTSVS